MINRVQLTPVAIAEAMNLVNNLKKGKKLNYNNIPTAVFLIQMLQIKLDFQKMKRD